MAVGKGLGMRSDEDTLAQDKGDTNYLNTEVMRNRWKQWVIRVDT